VASESKTAVVGNQILLFVGMLLSERAPDRAHPFGYGMNTYFWAFVVSAMFSPWGAPSGSTS
jgi:divalent metal cation (Fe/Co/Zn/Cd) transporter